VKDNLNISARVILKNDFDEVLAAMHKYLAFLKKKGRTDETLAHYESHLNDYFGYAESLNADIKRIDKAFITGYLTRQLLTVKSVTVNNKLGSLCYFYDFLLKNEIVSKNYFKDIKPLPVAGELQPSTVELREFEIIYAKIETGDGEFNWQDIAMFECFFGTGITTSELCDLHRDDFLFDERTLNVRSTKANKCRSIPLPHATFLALEKYVYARDIKWLHSDYLFPNMHGQRFQRTNVYKRIEPFLKLSNSTKKGAQTLRDSYTKHMLDRGANLVAVTRLLGHMNAETTFKRSKIY
jgi:integrase/recombinase XerD